MTRKTAPAKSGLQEPTQGLLLQPGNQKQGTSVLKLQGLYSSQAPRIVQQPGYQKQKSSVLRLQPFYSSPHACAYVTVRQAAREQRQAAAPVEIVQRLRSTLPNANCGHGQAAAALCSALGFLASFMFYAAQTAS